MYEIRIGHAHLNVRDLKRSVAFYMTFLSLKVTEEVAGRVAFLTGGAPHHELALSAQGMSAPAPVPDGVGLYHLAFDVPDKRAFALAYRKLTAEGIQVAPVDHRIGWGLYFQDPDGNGLEIYCDTRREADGSALWRGENRPLPRERILAELAD